MKRSQINAIIRSFEDLLSEYRFALPPFLSMTPDEWQDAGHEYDEIRDNALGWDVTDYGEGNFNQKGLSLITIRNGNTADAETYPKTYAEKIMMVLPGQVSPNHFHWNKMEDIINRGGGRIIFRLWNAADDDSLADTDVTIHSDGRTYTVPAGSDVILEPGQSLTLYPRQYHEFRIEDDSVPTLVGEVSMCNDDNTDNRFYEELGRFPTIEEDEPAYRLLCNEYPKAQD